MPRIKNMGSATMRFNEGIIVSGTIENDNTLIASGSAVIIGSLHISGSQQEGIRIGKGASDYRQIVFETDGDDGAIIQLTNAEHLAIFAEENKDTIFYTKESSDGSYLERARIKNSGKVGIGLNDPSYKLHVQDDVSDYVAIIDNDQSSSGHGLKVTSDGTGSGTNLLDVESASTTLFRVRGDGRVGIGKVSSLPAAVLTVSSSNSDSDLAIAHKIHHIGDSDTSISFDADNISFEAGGNTELQIDGTEGILVKEFIKHIGDTDTRIQFADNKIVIKAGNLALVTAEKNSSAPHEVTINDGGNNVDFVVKGNGSNQGNPGMKFDASTNKLGINGIGTPAYELEVAGNIGLAEYIYHRGDDNTYIRFQDDDINLQAGGRSMIKISEGSIDQVLIMSGGGGGSPDVKTFTDTNFFVSGSAGSRGSSTAGTSVFGGDLLVSGVLHIGNAYQLPISDGTNNQVIKTDGNGNLSFTNQSGGGGSGNNLEVTSQKTSDYTASNFDFVLVNLVGASSDVTITLPAASSDAQVAVKIAGAAMGKRVIVDGNASETIDGETTKILDSDYESIHMISDGSNWWRIS